MRSIKLIFSLIALLLAMSLTGCSSDLNSESSTGITSGVAVDPYIEGAVFKEVAADGVTVLQRESTPSDAKGVFVFSKPLTEGSTIEMKISRKGMHEGAPFEGMLKRKVNSTNAGRMVVSPLTTLLANGFTDQDIVALLSDAGLDLAEEDLYRDPMQALDNMGEQVSDDQLKPLHANMAINQFMTTIDQFDVEKNDLDDFNNFQLFAALVKANKDLLCASEFSRISSGLDGTINENTPLIIGDLVTSVVQTMRDVVADAKEQHANGNLNHAKIADDVNNALQSITQDVLALYLERVGEETPPDNVNGVDVYVAECAGCHNLTSGSVMDLSGKGTAVTAKIVAQHKEKILSAAQLQALVAYVDSQAITPTPDPDPEPTPDGQVVYDTQCAGCHKLGEYDMNGSDPDLAGSEGIITGKINAGHRGVSLSTAETTALVDWVAVNPVIPTPDPEPNPDPIPDGIALYESDCQGCHGPLNSNNILDRSFAGIEQAISSDLGGMGMLTLTADEVEAISHSLPTPTPDPDPVPVDGQDLYDDNCANCHIMGDYDSAGYAPELGGQGNQVITKIEAGHKSISLTADELNALATWANDNPAPVVDPDPVPVNGKTLYDDKCANCHIMGDYDTSGSAPELGGEGDLVITKIEGGHKSISLTAEELNALADWADENPAPVVVPDPDPVPANGKTLYDDKCANCHIMGDYDTSGSAPELGGEGDLVITKIEGGHKSISLTADELNALADWADENPAPVVVPDPDPEPVDGQTLYDGNCAYCHSVNEYDATGAPDLASSGDLIAPKFAAGHKNISLTTEEKVAIAGFVDLYEAVASGPDYSDCTACHAQPPNGSSFPNAAGSHAVHTALPGIGDDCSSCHDGATHDDVVDVVIAGNFDAKSGSATANANGTCSTVSCHGGETTPNWYTGSLSVNTQCASCHNRSTSEYNGYTSGDHKKHVSDKGYDCTVCHNTSKLEDGHFSNLSSSGFELSPASTIGGGSTRVGSYSGGRCSSVQCHGSENW